MKVCGGDYSSVSSFSEGFAVVVKNQKMGYVNKAGKVVIPIKYDVA
jgi:hypothetical protein